MKRLLVEACSEDGKKRVKVTQDSYGMYISSTTNGWHWTVVQVDRDHLKVYKECIDRVLEKWLI